MKYLEKQKALELRRHGHSINHIASTLGVSKSTASLWVRNIKLTQRQLTALRQKPFTNTAVEKRRKARLSMEQAKRDAIVQKARLEIDSLDLRDLWLMGVMLYWAEGGKTQRMVRFSNGDPQMICIMMQFFRLVCKVPESKFRGHIHIHPHLDYRKAELYWSKTAGIPLAQFFKTYTKQNKSSTNKKNTLPHGVMDIYVMNSALFLKISGWSQGIFSQATKLG